MEVRTKKKGRALEMVVHAESMEQAQAHVRSRFTKCEILNPIELDDVPKHFVVFELED